LYIYFLQEGLPSLEDVIEKNEGNKSCRKTFDLQTLFRSCPVHNSSKGATDLAKIGSKISQGAKVEAFMVPLRIKRNSHKQVKKKIFRFI
jgi:hypothetical protein